MAKRKRLELTGIETVSPDLETKSAFPPAPRSTMPIADVAGDVAGRAALEEVAREMTAAEEEGRIVKKIALIDIDTQHLSRDRIAFDSDEMEALRLSIAERGQQTPIEVLRTSGNRYGLISGLRRMIVLQELGASHALALIKRPETSQDAYQAMVEENEVRANLSFYERANIAVVAARQGVYPDAVKAVKALFAHSPKARRSKIGSFVILCEGLGDALRFPTHIPEHLGLALVKALKSDPDFARRTRIALSNARRDTPEDERKALEQCLKTPDSTSVTEPACEVPEAYREVLEPGLVMEAKEGRVVLSGPVVDGDFIEALRDWLARRP